MILPSKGGDDILELEVEDMQGIPQVMRRQGGAGTDRASACAGDGSLVVISGEYDGAPTIDGAALSATATTDSFFVRRGNLIATQPFKGGGVNRGTAADVAGGHAFAGDFKDSLIIPGASTPLLSPSNQSIWFADYDTAGKLQSFGSLRTAGADQAHAVLRVGGELWVVGEGEGNGISFTTTLGGSSLNGGSSGQPGRKRDALLVRIRTSPIGLNPLFFGGAQDDAARDAARDGSGGAWVVGNFRGIASLIGGPLTAIGGDDIFVLRLKP